MLRAMTKKFLGARQRLPSSGNNQLAQLLLIVSDGRGLFLEGVETVKQAVREAMSAGVFTVFVIIDNPKTKVSPIFINVHWRKKSHPLYYSLIEQSSRIACYS